jgi:hypothetical protein
MLATGQPFLKAVRSLAAEYRVPVPGHRGTPQDIAHDAERMREREQNAYSFREGLLDLIDGELIDEKAKLFDPLAVPNERYIRTLTELERFLRQNSGRRAVVQQYEAFRQVLPELAARVVTEGYRLRRSCEDFGLWLIDRLAEMEDR